VNDLNTGKKISLFLIVVITALFSFSAFRGIEVGGFKMLPMKQKMELGLDLAGGVYVVLEAQTEESGEALREKMEQTRSIIRQRVDSIGVSEPNIVIEGEKRIRVELAGVKDPQEAIDLIGKTALLEFQNASGEVVVTGGNIKKSSVGFQNTGMGEQPVVSIEFDSKGAELFREETARLVSLPPEEDKRIAIVLDGAVISNPTVNSEKFYGGVGDRVIEFDKCGGASTRDERNTDVCDRTDPWAKGAREECFGGWNRDCCDILGDDGALQSARACG
jgi:preprotein translocase subunit SecD